MNKPSYFRSAGEGREISPPTGQQPFPGNPIHLFSCIGGYKKHETGVDEMKKATSTALAAILVASTCLVSSAAWAVPDYDVGKGHDNIPDLMPKVTADADGVHDESKLFGQRRRHGAGCLSAF